MIAWETALEQLLALRPPLPVISMPLAAASGMTLAANITAKRTQPAADLSAMDGYAVRFADMPGPFELIGESAAGGPFSGEVGPMQAVRIFTGAYVPLGADTVLIQEDVTQLAPQKISTTDTSAHQSQHIRKSGSDFKLGDTLLRKGQLLSAGAIAVAAMGNYDELPVYKTPKIGIIASGDELVFPGQDVGIAQIPCSNSVMLSAILSSLPCEIIDFGIAKDTMADLKNCLHQAKDCDIIVTTGGASVGDHDLVQSALKELGANMAFWRVAIRPGKPLMAGTLGNTVVLGLPGNPTSAFVTAVLFLLPLVRQLSGDTNPNPEIQYAPTLQDLPMGGKRTEFMRAFVDQAGIRTFGGQDSGLTTPLAMANALLCRAIDAPPCKTGDLASYIKL
jgi:molybdopterin molybdotransferase